MISLICDTWISKIKEKTVLSEDKFLDFDGKTKIVGRRARGRLGIMQTGPGHFDDKGAVALFFRAERLMCWRDSGLGREVLANRAQPQVMTRAQEPELALRTAECQPQPKLNQITPQTINLY